MMALSSWHSPAPAPGANCSGRRDYHCQHHPVPPQQCPRQSSTPRCDSSRRQRQAYALQTSAPVQPTALDYGSESTSAERAGPSGRLPPLPPQRHQRGPKPWHVTQQTLDDVVTMFETMPFEYDYWVDSAWVTGSIPTDLRGTYLRNGPGLQVKSGRHPRHFMDGDGCVLSLAFPGDGAMPRFTNRYVRTKGFVDEQVAGKPLYRNAFTRGAADGSPLFNPFDLSFKNVANTSVLYWAKRLWALWEVGLPYELNPHTLDTRGESNMDGQIQQRLAGHYRVVTESNGEKRLVTFGAKVSFTGMQVAFYETDTTGRVVQQSQHRLEGLDIMFIHDMLVTENWYIIVMGPVKIDGKAFVTDYMTSGKSLAELLVYDKQGLSKVLLYPRPGKAPAQAKPKVIPAPAFFSWHHVNAYERNGGTEVVVDTISWQDVAFDVTQYTVKPDYYRGGCRSQLYRLVLDLTTNSLVSCDRLLRRTVEFPTPPPAMATGKPYKYAYMTSDAVDDEQYWGPGQAVIKVSLPQEPETNTSSSSSSSSATVRPDLLTHSQASSHSQKTHNSAQSSKGEGSDQAPAPVFTPPAVHNPYTPLRQAPQASPVAAPRAAAAARRPPPVATCDEWRPGPRCFPQEATFVPRINAKSEDDGYLIVGVHNAETRRGEIAILDARRVSEGPVAVIHLPHALPCGLHGTWAEDYLGPDPSDVGVPVWRTPHTIREL